jgi:bifunctional non-homologous end joining protein LigD
MQPVPQMLDRHRPAKLLKEYRAKRNFEATPEPSGEASPKSLSRPRFVIQKHHASRLHYDFRLEAEGVLKSWAIPKGPSLDPSVRRLAMMVEDHPLAYFDFEGVIPSGYGAGEVIVWDVGTYAVVGDIDPAAAIRRGHLKFELHGTKLKGRFALVKMKGRGGDKDNAWLLVKDKDDAVDKKWNVEKHPESALTGRTLADIKADKNAAEWQSHDPATKTKTKTKTKTATAKRTSKPAAPQKLPPFTSPMLATLIEGPFDDPKWVFEIKWDGFRAVADIDEAGEVKLLSRTRNDLLPQFPELEQVLRDAFDDAPVRVDGEVVTLDAEGRSSFQRLQGRLSRNASKTTRARLPVAYVVFDCLYARGRSLLGETLEQRKAILEEILRADTPGILLSKHVPKEGTALFGIATERGLEGIIGKRLASKYVEGRSRDWVKIKVHKTQDCVIAGYTDPRGARDAFGSLLMGVYEKGTLVYAGNVGTGFTRASLADLMAEMRPLETTTCPFASKPKTRTKAHWLVPKLVGEVQFTEWTRDGSMRHPSFLGTRRDKRPTECLREIPE